MRWNHVRALGKGACASALALLLALGATTMVAQALPAPLGPRIDPSDLAPTAGDCVCPPPSKLSFYAGKRIPTRCLKENVTADGRRVPYPINSAGRPYPNIAFPNGYPPALLSTESGRIPFPGWPRDKPPRDNRPSQWDKDASLRGDYKEWYTRGGGGEAPGEASQAFNMYTRRGQHKLRWGFWEIHHIMERQYAGQDNYTNLVPVYAFPNKATGKTQARWLETRRPNQHNEFTQWWEHLYVECQTGVALYNCEPSWKKSKQNCPRR